jgi:hypothetical protein
MTTSTKVTGYSYGYTGNKEIVDFEKGRLYKYLAVRSQYGWEDGCEDKDYKVLENVVCTSISKGSAHYVGTAIFKPQNEVVVETCSNCGGVIGVWDIEYVTENPQGFEYAVEQAGRKHRSGSCVNSRNYDTVAHCSRCGMEIGRWDEEYCYSNPDGLDCAMEQAQEEHYMYECSVTLEDDWATWRRESYAQEDETPREMVKKFCDSNMWQEVHSIPTPPDRDSLSDWLTEIDEIIESR